MSVCPSPACFSADVSDETSGRYKTTRNLFDSDFSSDSQIRSHHTVTAEHRTLQIKDATPQPHNSLKSDEKNRPPTTQQHGTLGTVENTSQVRDTAGLTQPARQHQEQIHCSWAVIQKQQRKEVTRKQGAASQT